MSEIKTEGSRHQQTLCWDCENATGGCSWADHNDHTPVKGWDAIPTRIKVHNPSQNAEISTSYIVLDCPEFIRNAEGFGTRRIGDRERHNEEKQQIITAYRCGVRVKDIERVSGYSESQIYNILKDADVKIGARRTGRRPSRWAAIATKEE